MTGFFCVFFWNPTCYYVLYKDKLPNKHGLFNIEYHIIAKPFVDLQF